MLSPGTENVRMRKCNSCGYAKPLSAYHRDSSLKEGRRYTCKECAKRRARASQRRKNQQTNGLWSVYRCMKQRCCNARHVSYPRYGGRGIRICDEWLEDFEAFHHWAMQNGYQSTLQLDRIDNDGHYTPQNCRFVTPAQNMHNSSNAKLCPQDIRGIRELLTDGLSQRQIARQFEISQSIISQINTGTIWRDVE